MLGITDIVASSLPMDVLADTDGPGPGDHFGVDVFLMLEVGDGVQGFEGGGAGDVEGFVDAEGFVGRGVRRGGEVGRWGAGDGCGGGEAEMGSREGEEEGWESHCGGLL